MNTDHQNQSHNNFIYAIGFFCLLNIWVTEFSSEEELPRNEIAEMNQVTTSSALIANDIY